MKIEVLGAERRRRWRAEDKARIVAETLAGAEPVSEVARRHDVCPSLVFAWRRQAREGRFGSVDAPPPLVPIEIESEAAGASSVTACGPQKARRAPGLIEIDLASGARLRVDRDVDADALRRVLDVLADR